MELDTLILSKVSQKEKDKYHMIPRIWNLIFGTNEPSYRRKKKKKKKLMDMENRAVVAKGRE